MALAPQRLWIMPTKATDAPDGIAALVAQVLACRGIAVSEMAAFLAARPADAGPPMRDLDRAVERLRRALATGERIVVYGDYDVDGIAGSAILVRVFRELGATVAAYIPNRYEEGYGINAAALRHLATDGAKVVVSVDCGVTAVNEALLARDLGIDLIVTDHHHPPSHLPDSFALAHPRRPGALPIERDPAAAGVDDAEDALRLLVTEEPAEAKELAERLEQRNTERQELTRLVVAGARERAEERPDAWATVVADAAWPAGVVGLGASRLVEDYGRPAAVIAIDGLEGKGSCRSIAGVHIAEALDVCDDILIKHGGHATAAGFSVAVDRIPELAERLDVLVRERLGGVRPVPTIRVDAEIAPEALTARLALELADLEPCGAGNPRPRLLVRDVRVFDIRQVGAGSDHLRCKVMVDRFTFDAIAFRRGDHADAMTDAGRVDAVVTIGTGLRGFVELQLEDFGPVGTAREMTAIGGLRPPAPVLRPSAPAVVA